MFKSVLPLALCLVFPLPVFALELMHEEEMSELSAQDGLSVLVALPTNGWRASEVSLTDKGGITTVAGYNNDGTILATNVGFKTCYELTINGSCTSPNAPTLKFSLDMVGDNNGSSVGGGAMLNIAFSLIGGANKMRFYIDKIKLRNGPKGGNEKVIIDFGGRSGADIDLAGDYVDIVPIGSPSLFSLQLGNDSLGHLLHFTNGKFGTIDFGRVALVDASNAANTLNFGFKLDEFDITGAGFDINNDGLIFTDSNFGKGLMDITISDIKMGGSTAASMGTIGLQNINVKDLVVTIAGKN